MNGKLWNMEPHTAAKHAILRNYLGAWLPIMTTWNGRVIFLDGFAGPGEYAGGEPGSPLIAIDAALNHRKTITARVRFIFIEKDPERCQHLQALLKSRYTTVLPQNLSCEVVCGKFDDTLSGILDYLDEQQSRIAPTFAFIDPFGYSDTPFDVIVRLMKHPKCELLINFNYEELNRFLAVESQWPHFDRQFGTVAWRQTLDATSPGRRQQALHDLYRQQLKGAAGIPYVLSFQMVNRGNRTDYFLFFGTKAYEGLRQMKHAMWAIERTGAYQFSDRRDFAQPYLIKPEPDVTILKLLIVQHFRGMGDFAVEDLEKFVIVETPFLETHFKLPILRPMEERGELKVKDTRRKRAFTYPPGTRLAIP